jgi:Lon protease-like protein
MEEYLLPLFPLEVVLLPEELLPLHIFEERYKQMIGECLEAKTVGSIQQEFGVVHVKDQALSPVGCTARIVNVTRKYTSGRMDILTVGKRRFEILLTNEEMAYLRAAVDFFDDDEGSETAGEAEALRAIELFRGIKQRLHKSAEMPIHLPPPYKYLSFRIAASLPLDLEFKRQLLSIRNETERLGRVIRVIELMTSQLDLLEKARAKSGGNGNLRH